ncbi:DNA/RNA non-specific endonuclease [Leuconostoc gasicomitatum]|uniref:DNA/RNA non-specific endonuclease n=1 Tax=Leuconostoc gasicomitatum TaxID=115778 RepID=UPI0007E1AE0D|nr:DNA/RNA non-specific endonuclease [Leuconostoc gasicomitatum]CUW06029.1 DNA-entry nuclease (Competence-specific nuclease) [Leuconostoc gasicomitatum]
MKNYRHGRFAKIIVLIVILISIFGYAKRNQITQNIVSLTSQSNLVNIDKKTSNPTENEQLAQMSYQGQTVVPINNDQPTFSQNDLTLKNTDIGWQKLSSLDWLGRPQAANALLNQKLMPPAQKNKARERLTIKTPGYHAIKTGNNNTDWLYNRSHLIGFQFTGLNNEAKNLITGTRQLNADSRVNAKSMLTYETEIANYLKYSPERYVRYRVEPIYRNVELVPRGIHMMAQSIGNNDLIFNVYVFNVQNGWQINYLNGNAEKE